MNNEHAKAHGANWKQWLGHLIGDPSALGVELGTWKGDSADFILSHILTGPEAELICVDTFEGSEEHRLAGMNCENLEEETRRRLSAHGNRVHVVKRESHQFLKSFSAQVDFVYIDAAHDAKNVLRDSVLAWELLKVGGVVIWDDYECEVFDDELEQPKLAIDSFLACYAKEIEVLGVGYQVAVRKTA